VVIPIAVISSIVIIIAFFRLLQSTGRPALWPSRERPWSIGWSLFTTSPFLGNGTGSTKILLALDESIPTEPYLVHTHNLFLQIGSELGLIGIIFVMWLVIEFIRRIYVQLLNSNTRHRIRTAAIAASLSTVFIHHLVDYLLVAPIYVATITILTAYLYSGYSREVSTPQLSLNQSRVFALLSTFFVIAGFYPGGSFAYQKSLNVFTENPSMEAVEHICDVASKHSYQPFFKLGCAQKSAEVSYEDENKSAQEAAIKAYKEAFAMDPYWPIHWANLAAVEWDSGRRLDALDHMKLALESAPDYAITNLNIGRMYENLGEDELSYKHYQIALETEPLLLESAFFDKNDYSLEELISSKPYSHEFTANYRARVGLYYLFYDQVSAAQEEFLEVLKISPAHPTARSGLAYINLLEGSLEAAQTNIEVALYSGTNTPWIHYIAGKIAYLQGDTLDWRYHFDRAISLYKNRSDSDRYYNVVYQETYNNPDTVPQLTSIIISEEARVDFLYYAEEIDEVDPLKSNMIKELMNLASPK
jgi:tetratricopeptide (TPR) repeat protein